MVGYLDDHRGRTLAAARPWAFNHNVAHVVLLPGELALVRKVLQELEHPAGACACC